MKISPEIRNDKQYRQSKAWFIAGGTVFILGIFFFPQLAVFGLIICLLVASVKYMRARKKYLIA